MNRYSSRQQNRNVSMAEIIENQEKRHKPLPPFEWHGPLENYYIDGECYYDVFYIQAKCMNGTGISEIVYGNELPSKKRALWDLTKKCNCGATWHDF